MPNHLHDKIEHFIIHLVAFLFAFSTISAAFLGYGVYQTSTSATNIATPKVINAAGPNSTWTQNSWTGGGDLGSSYTISWGSTGGWNKYSSTHDSIIDSNGIKHDSGSQNMGEIVSSIFDTGSKRLGYIDTDQSAVVVWYRSGSTPTAVLSALWESSCGPAKDNQYAQYKFDLVDDYVSEVHLRSAIDQISGTVKDASTGDPVIGASVSSRGQSYNITTFNQNKHQLLNTTYAAGFRSGFYSLAFDHEASNTTYSVTASAPGYVSQTKSATVSDNYCNFAATADFSLSKTPSSLTSSGQTTTKKGTASTPSVSLSDFQQIKLPAVFTAAESTTTDLSKVADPKKIETFTLDIPGKNKIVFKDPLDLSAKYTADTLKELDKYVKIDGIGIVELDSKTIPALNKKAVLTMYGLKYVSTPTVLIDGKVDSQKIVSNIKYTGGVLTFDVSHFTKYEVAAKFELLAPISTSVSSPNTIIKDAYLIQLP